MRKMDSQDQNKSEGEVESKTTLGGIHEGSTLKAKKVPQNQEVKVS